MYSTRHPHTHPPVPTHPPCKNACQGRCLVSNKESDCWADVWLLEKQNAGWSRGCCRKKVSGGVEVWVLEKEGAGWSRGCWRRKVPGGVEVWVLEKEGAGWSRGLGVGEGRCRVE